MSSTNVNQKNLITTHILDTTKGQPAVDILVHLYRLENDKWTLLNERRTESNGRAILLQGERGVPGTYKIEFHVSEYFTRVAYETMYPTIVVMFEVREPSYREHYHIPLLLNPFGYSTYRGT